MKYLVTFTTVNRFGVEEYYAYKVNSNLSKQEMLDAFLAEQEYSMFDYSIRNRIEFDELRQDFLDFTFNVIELN